MCIHVLRRQLKRSSSVCSARGLWKNHLGGLQPALMWGRINKTYLLGEKAWIQTHAAVVSAQLLRFAHLMYIEC